MKRHRETIQEDHLRKSMRQDLQSFSAQIATQKLEEVGPMIASGRPDKTILWTLLETILEKPNSKLHQNFWMPSLKIMVFQDKVATTPVKIVILTIAWLVDRDQRENMGVLTNNRRCRISSIHSVSYQAAF